MSVGLICGWEKCRYEAQNLVKAFFPGEQFLPDAAGDVTVYIEVEQGALPLVKAVVRGAEGEYSASEQAAQNAYLSAPDLDMALGRAVFRILSQYTGRQLPWGILTGVRPVKLFLGLSAELGEAEAERVFREQLYVTPQKTDLVCRTAHGQHRAVGDCFDNQCSLYVSIPFCPTRCAYCSFVSQDNDKCGDKLVKPYLELLHREIGHTLDFIRHSGKTLKSIYIGGGTPAVLSAEQLGRLIELLNTAGKTDEFT
ncbi:MAG: hypothetical protein IJC25_04375, partial [Clostridia bacterium]|nr:hypothetical protein [Clostridia bacterium]